MRHKTILQESGKIRKAAAAQNQARESLCDSRRKIRVLHLDAPGWGVEKIRFLRYIGGMTESAGIMDSLDALRAAGIGARFTRFSALDRYFRTGASPVLSVNVSCGVIDLAKLFPGLRYPGIEGVDAGLACGEAPHIYFTCTEGGAEAEGADEQPFEVLKLLYDPFRDSFYDPAGIYPLLRSEVVRLRGASDLGRGYSPVADAAVLVSRYSYRLEHSGEALAAEGPEFPGREALALFPVERQRALLSCVLSGRSAFEGLRLLADSGFVGALWPELASLRSVAHSKEYHPEGDVWDHTLETFRYRKDTGLTIALALLLHDAGKPYAGASGSRRFDRHAEIGCAIAEKFLNRLGFQQDLVRDVCFLVRNHMLPGLIKTLPTYRTESVMASPLFPLLLEVYRCDLSSTFRGPDGYYEACKVYRAFLKHRKNPYRTSDGKKIRRVREEVLG
jgi:poly(A) polymerase